MSTILSVKNVKKTRNPQKCDWCGERIKSGEPSVTMAAIWEGDFSSVRFHPECKTAWSATDWKEYEEWDCFDQHRGKTMQDAEAEE